MGNFAETIHTTMKIKTLTMALAAVLIAGVFTACNDDETYADQKKRERNSISRYIRNNGINVLSERDFLAQDSTTDVEKNQYVLFEQTGVYMQIVREGCGERLKDGETATVLCRFDEYNILDNDTTLQLTNNRPYYAAYPEHMSVKNTSGTFTASFTGNSLMTQAYSSTTVPTGWLVPLPYIKLGRPSAEGEEVAKVRLIVPHTAGHAYATQNVYPCFYEITYERGR